jgi:hypothetical protein
MDLSITNNTACARITGYQVCLDYRVPALQKVFKKFLEQYPQITGYTNCSREDVSKISCLSDSYKVTALIEKVAENSVMVDAVNIGLFRTRKKYDDYLALSCTADGCTAKNHEGIMYGFSDSEDGECFEFLTNPKIEKPEHHKVPCDGEVSLFEEYLKQASFTLEAYTAMPPPNAPNATGGPMPAPTPANPPAAPQPAPTPKAPTGGPTPAPTPANPPAAPQPAPSSSSSSQKNTAFSIMQKVLGVAGTIFLAYKTSKEMKNKESGSRALGYGGAAIAAGVFTIYSMRA